MTKCQQCQAKNQLCLCNTLPMAPRRERVMAVENPPIDGRLKPARAALGSAISALIDPRPETLDNQTHWLNPRYHELREALTSQRNGARSAPRSQEPAWLAAIELLARIDHRARQLEPTCPINQCDEYPTVQRLRALAERKWRPQDTLTITAAANDLETYAADFNELLAPQPKYLPDKCPRCGRNKAVREIDDESSDNGKATIRTPALQITEYGCTCNNCHEHWPPERLMFLGRLLGYRIEGVLE